MRADEEDGPVLAEVRRQAAADYEVGSWNDSSIDRRLDVFAVIQITVVRGLHHSISSSLGVPLLEVRLLEGRPLLADNGQRHPVL